MKILVCGSRSWNDPLLIKQCLSHLPGDSTIIQGGAVGADKMAARAAESLNLKVLEFLPDWELYGRRAGFVRNIEMLNQEPDLVIAFWNGTSKGTLHTIREAVKRGIRVEIPGERRVVI